MHLLSTKQVTKTSELDNLFSQANIMRNPWQYGIDPVALARGLVLGIVKDEGSTRTRVSFEVAMKRLGGDVTLLELDKNSSIAKGETVEDTIRNMSEYVEAIVMRHSKKGMVKHCSKFSQVPVINAGDGDGEHPTQALLDAYTIHNEIGRLNNLSVMLVGDLKCSRTVHSLIHLLSLYNGNRFYLISPKDMQMPQEYKFLGMWHVEHEEIDGVLNEVGRDIDVVYMTRFQRERYLSNEEVIGYLNRPKSESLIESIASSSDKSYYTLSEHNIKCLKPECRVLHPLPRNSEIPISFDSDPRAAYFRQAKNGMYVRMALLNNYFRKKDFFSKGLSTP